MSSTIAVMVPSVSFIARYGANINENTRNTSKIFPPAVFRAGHVGPSAGARHDCRSANQRAELRAGCRLLLDQHLADLGIAGQHGPHLAFQVAELFHLCQAEPDSLHMVGGFSLFRTVAQIEVLTTRLSL